MRLFIQDFVDLFYSTPCLCCKNKVENNALLCVECLMSLPQTNFELTPKANLAHNRLVGKINVSNTVSLFYQKKNSVLTSLIYALKYHGKKEVPSLLLSCVDRELLKESFQGVQCITYVPVSKSKLKIRCYNQSALIADMLGELLNVPVIELLKKYDSKSEVSQTKLSREKRSVNLKGTIGIHEKNIAALSGEEKLLLVDDVLTTGATIEVCVQQLERKIDAPLSVFTLAIAE